jgi:hypothetical protein
MMVAVLPTIDTVAPVVSITAPAAGVPIFGLVSITADATDDSGISNVVFQVGQTEVADSTAPFEMLLNTATFIDGDHTLTVTALDPSNNSASATLVLSINNASVTPPPDTTNPTLVISSPANGTSVSGDVVVSVNADDDTGVASVVFSIDGTGIGTSITPPFQQSWDTTAFSDDNHNVVVTAFDSAGNSASSSINVVVENSSAPPPVCTVYSCPNPPPPPTEPPPDPVIPDGSSPDGEFEGVVTNVDLQAFTVTVDTEGASVTVKITSDTVFNGSIATSISQILIGHVAQGEFFQSTSETVWIEADLPPGL